MDSIALEERRRKLEERFKNLKSSQLLAVRLDVIEKVIADLGGNPNLKSLFGEHVAQHLALVFDKVGNDILIADANIEHIANIDELKFLRILQDIVNKDMR